MNNRKIQYLTSAGMIAALYVVLTFVSSMVGMSSGVIQVRLSESLNMLVCFTSATIPGMFVGCLAANLLTGGCALDLVAGSIATFIGIFLGRKISTLSRGKYNLLVPVPTILSNAIIVPIVLQKGYGVSLPYTYLAATVGAGELISAGIFGIILYFALLKVPQFKKMLNSKED